MKQNKSLFTNILAITILFISICPGLFASENRLALIIGNESYRENPLQKPVYDAEALSKALKSFGFKVILKTNVEQQAMDDALEQFSQQLEAGAIALFYYSGYGMQSKGNNYLLPLNSRLKREKDLKYNAVNVAEILDKIASVKTQVNIVILDVIQNNSLARAFKSDNRGLARVEHAPSDTLIAISNAMNKQNYYTEHLIQAIKTQHQPVEMVFKEVTKSIKLQTNGQQTPWVSSSLVGDFYFLNTQQTTYAGQQESNYEARFWGMFERSDSQSMYETYLLEYPNGHYVEIAKSSLLKFQSSELTLRSNVNGDTVFINGEEKGSTRLDLSLKPGSYEIEVKKDGYSPYKETITLKDKESKTIRAVLTKIRILSDFEQLQQRAEQGNRVDQYLFAAEYEKNKHYQKALYWLRKSASQGYSDALSNIARYYYYGYGMPVNYEKAYNYYIKALEGANAANDGIPEMMIAGMYKEGNGRAKNNTEAFNWYKQSAEKANAYSQVMLGAFYSTGISVKQDYKKAFYWNKKAADQGYDEAQLELGLFYLNGYYVRQDYKKACQWFKKAARQDHDRAQLLVGLMYAEGKGVSKDESKAISWLIKSAKSGNQLAQTLLKKSGKNW